MLTKTLGSKKITVILFLLLLFLGVLEGWTQKVPATPFILVALPLTVNLVCCIFGHVRRIRQWNALHGGFILFHLGFLVIIAGGVVTYLTYSMGYIEIAEGNGFSDRRENYSGWRQRFGTRRGTGAEIGIKKIHMTFWENGQLKDYYNDIVIRDGARQEEATVRINGSVRHGGLLINLARFYGLAPYFTLTAPGIQKSGYVYISSTTKTNTFVIPAMLNDIQVSYDDLRDRKVTVRSKGGNGSSRERTMEIGDSIPLGDARLTLSDVRIWNALTVVGDGGRWITFSGFGFFLLGLAVYYWKRFTG
jgi:cytochrome c biogenesis protein ResB